MSRTSSAIEDVVDAFRSHEVMGSVQKYTHSGLYARINTAYFINDPFSLIGSLYRGGRFNYSRTFATRNGLTPTSALYLADDALTAAHEALRNGLPPSRVAYGVRVDLERVLDLRDAAVLRALGITRQALSVDWEKTASKGRDSASQRIGHALSLCGVGGILTYTVKRRGHTNLTVFHRNLVTGRDQIQVYDTFPLPGRPPLRVLTVPMSAVQFP